MFGVPIPLLAFRKYFQLRKLMSKVNLETQAGRYAAVKQLMHSRAYIPLCGVDKKGWYFALLAVRRAATALIIGN